MIHRGVYRRRSIASSIGYIMASTLVKVRALALVLLAVRVPSALMTPCTDDAGCSYNGACRGRTCRCEPQWKGAACAELNLIPTPRGGGYQPTSLPPAHNTPPSTPHIGSRVSTWGGPVVHHDGAYHMYVGGFLAWPPSPSHRATRTSMSA